MRTKMRSKFSLLLIALAAMIAIPAALAIADTLQINNTLVVGSNATKDAGESGTGKVWLDSSDNSTDPQNGCNATGSAPVTVSFTSSAPSKIAAPSSVQLTGCGTGAAKDFSYSVASGATQGPVTISGSVSGGRGGTYNTSDTLTVTINAPANEAPSVPGTPGTASNPNQGVFGLTWTASTDDGNPSGSSLTYTLQHKDANDAAYTNVATGLSGNSYSFGTTNPEGEGTWNYRVKASDGSLESVSNDSAAITVDQSAPNAPSVTADRAPDYDGTGDDDWYKNTVTASFTDNGDPDLADGSLGSGVDPATVPTAVTKNTSGPHTISGTVKDKVANESPAGSLSVKVDATKPSVNISCPTSTVIVGANASANWSASDDHSGLASADSGSVTLDTNSEGQKTATAPTATDNVGLTSAPATCTYNVAYSFNGFLQPIDGHSVNTGKYGKTYPIKWQLRDSSGALISDSAAQALVGKMSGGQKSTSCTSFDLSDTDALEEATTGNTALRYDATSDQFIYNYKAPSSGSCYVFAIRNADGLTTQQIDFKFTK